MYSAYIRHLLVAYSLDMRCVARTQRWYQFNDETVTRIESLVPKLDTGKKGAKGSKDAKKSVSHCS